MSILFFCFFSQDFSMIVIIMSPNINSFLFLMSIKI